MSEKMLPAAEDFVARVRGLFAEAMSDEDRWAKARDYQREFLADPELKAHAATWPDSLVEEGKPANLLFYEDPDYGFVINALIKKPGLKTSVHDHGRSWTLYGVLEGGETVRRFVRSDDGPQIPETATVEPAGEHEVAPGYIDFVPPWEIHQEINGPHRTVAVIVRSEKSGGFVQNRFDTETGRAAQYGGPVQVPFDLR